MKKYFYAVGLEIHAELATRTKMFCGCKNDPDEERPNLNICPVCVAHPGTLPIINKRAVESVIKVGLALGGQIADFSEFDRKNYFYPDIPKGFQISQYKHPIVLGGRLAGFDITRVHLEEDTGTNKHDRGEYSLVDFNRAGVPLMELVTEPRVFASAEDTARGASDFAKELQLLLRYLGTSEANMEKGEMRVEANISVSEDEKKLGTKVEVKNLNSFRSVEGAVKFEFGRMMELIEQGKDTEIVQETRRWDEAKQKTISQRKKESSHDYRYFPEPDLPKMKLHEAFDLEKMKSDLPELPEERRERYRKFGIKDEDIESYVVNPELGGWFEGVAAALKNQDRIKTASNYITSDYMGLRKSDPTVKLPAVSDFSELVNLFCESKISSRAAKDILAVIVKAGGSPFKIATEQGLLQVSDESAIRTLAEKAVAENPEIAASYRSGKEGSVMALVGKVMKESKGAANPEVVARLLKEILSAL